MSPSNLSTPCLLAKLIGESKAQMLYKGSLRDLLCYAAYNPALYMLAVAHELAVRACYEEMQNEVRLASPDVVKNYLKTYFMAIDCEAFVCIFTNVSNRLIEVREVARGTLTQTSVYPREIVKRALGLNAASVILAHNHPSGIAEPSSADHLLTRAVKQALNLVDVEVLDHLIIAGTATYSFAESGQL